MAKPGKIPGSAEDVEAAYYEAIASNDVDALMALWADDDDIVCVHPGATRLIGHAAIRASWVEVFERGGVRLAPTLLHVNQNMMSAVHSVLEEVRTPGQEPQDLHIVATNVYLKTPVGWRIVMHHASVAPGQAPASAPSGTVLH
ncbi:YybH family protein [Noviherbaspirillum pedocola]|uniref:Nuclear transport factor 2 family protein n=1 Tax=Noviherbaspirillum pedocola TaxID=2801341 RepID=A0A934SV52_9BURK|nr:nuclear transport factor 2 family protein [Noviherbaspirillum pedocola]MBK4733319.1 nuclear transport factor 2 family protein [Noviherbaspirillum pedocola]